MTALKRSLRWFLYGLAGLLGLLVVAGVAVFVILRSEAGQDWLARTIESQASTPGELSIEIGRIEGKLPQQLQIQDLVLHDGKGPWLKLAAVSLEWSPLALTDRLVKVEALALTDLQILRAPEGPQETEPSDEVAPAEPPSLPVDIVIDSLSIDDLIIAEDLAGHAARFKFGAKAKTTDRRDLEADLHLEGIDPAGELLAATVEFKPRSDWLKLEALLNAPSTGLLAAIMALPDRPALNFSLLGEGPISDWQGSMTGRLDGHGDLRGELALTQGDELEVSTQGSLRLDSPLIADFRSLVDGGVTFDIRGGWSPDAVITLAPSQVTTNALALTMSGRFATETQEFSADSALSLLQAEAIQSLIAPLSLEGLALNLEASGRTNQPELSAELSVDNLNHPMLQAESVSFDVDAGAKGPIDQPGAAIAAKLSGGLAGLTTADLGLPPGLIGQDVDLQTTAELALDDLLLSIEEAELTTGALQAGVQGTIDLNTIEADLEIGTALSDLSLLSDMAGMDLAGRFDLAGTVNLAEAGKQIAAELAGGLREFVVSDPVLMALLGSTVELATTSSLNDTEGLRVDTLTLAGAAFDLESSASLGPAFDTVEADYALQLPDASVLSESLGMTLAGAASLTGQAIGPIDNLTIEALLEAQDVIADTVALASLEAKTTVEDLPASPKGDLALLAQGPFGPLSASTLFALSGDLLSVSQLKLSGLQVEASGDATVPLNGSPVVGDLSLRAADLRHALEFAGLAGGGALDLDVTLLEEDGEQGAKAKLSASALSFASGDAAPIRLASLAADVVAKDLLGDPRADVNLEARDLSAAPAALSETRLSASGGLSGADWSLSTAGDLFGELAITADGRLALKEKVTSLALSALQGRLLAQDLRLQAPTEVHLTQGGMTLEDLSLEFAGAKISAAAQQSAKSIAGRLSIASLPLSLIRTFDPANPLQGSLALTAELDGPLTKPQGRARLTLDDVTMLEEDLVPPVDAVVNADWRNGKLSAQGSITGIGKNTAEVTAELPLILQPEPLSILLPDDKPIAINLTRRGPIEELVALLPLADHDVRGLSDIALAVGGTLAQPKIDGQVSVTEGRYENVASGTLLENIELLVEGNDKQVRLSKLAATDGEKGHLSGEGTVSIDAEQGFPAEINLTIDKATLVRLDEVTAVTSGTLGYAGSIEKAKLEGDLVITPIEVRIPSTLPPEVADLEVIEESSTLEASENETAEATEEAPPPLIVDLDVDVSVPNRAFVRGRGLESEWKGDIKVTGTSEAPEIAGQLELVRGDLELLGKSYKLQSGVITLNGGPNVDPDIDIRAVQEGPDLTVNIVLAGPASNPELTLSSVPELPQDEILARMLFGRGTDQLSPAEAVQLAASVAQLTGATGGPGALDLLRSGLGVDVLRVGSNEDGEANVTAGKYIGDKVFVGVEQGIGADSGGVTVEVELTPNISVESGVGQTGDSNVGVKFKWDY